MSNIIIIVVILSLCEIKQITLVGIFVVFCKVFVCLPFRLSGESIEA